MLKSDPEMPDEDVTVGLLPRHDGHRGEPADGRGPARRVPRRDRAVRDPDHLAPRLGPPRPLDAPHGADGPRRSCRRLRANIGWRDEGGGLTAARAPRLVHQPVRAWLWSRPVKNASLRGSVSRSGAEPLDREPDRLRPRDLPELPAPALAGAKERARETRRRVVLHDAGGALRAEHAAVDGMVRVTLDVPYRRRPSGAPGSRTGTRTCSRWWPGLRRRSGRLYSIPRSILASIFHDGLRPPGPPAATAGTAPSVDGREAWFEPRGGRPNPEPRGSERPVRRTAVEAWNCPSRHSPS